MKLYSTLTRALFLLATVAHAVTSPITEMALREYQANGRHQATRQKLFKAGRHRPTETRRMQSGSAMNFADLFKHLETARKAVEKQRKMETIFNEMLQITNGYKN